MAAIAILIIIVLLFTLVSVERTFSIGVRGGDDLHINVVFTLLGALVSIIVAAFITTCGVYWYKRYRETALRMHGWQVLAVNNEDVTSAVASNTNNSYTSSHECPPVIPPSPACSCQGSHPTKKISTIVDHTESKRITETTLIMDELQHRKTQRHHTRIDFTSGSTLNKAQENSIPVTVTHDRVKNDAKVPIARRLLDRGRGASSPRDAYPIAQQDLIFPPYPYFIQNPFENVALHRENVSSGTPSELESYC